MKLAVIFPGIGYHTDKPLLYYSKKLAKEYGFEIMEVTYGPFERDIKGSPDKMKKAFLTALSQTEDILSKIDFSGYSDILFISKSVGTAVAAAYTKEHPLTTYHVYYTPVAASFDFMGTEGIVFTGTNDPWVSTDIVIQGCEEHGLPLFITEGGNHSLETGDAFKDITNLSVIMTHTKNYIESISREVP